MVQRPYTDASETVCVSQFFCPVTISVGHLFPLEISTCEQRSSVPHSSEQRPHSCQQKWLTLRCCSQTYRESLNLLLRFRSGLLQLCLRLPKLALQGSPGSLQGSQLGLTFLQRQLQLCELALQLQFLLLMLQTDLEKDRNAPLTLKEDKLKMWPAVQLAA